LILKQNSNLSLIEQNIRDLKIWISIINSPDGFGILLDPQGLRVVSDRRELPLGGLKLRVIGYIGLKKSQVRAIEIWRLTETRVRAKKMMQ
jgi:hypothetical protein